MSDKQKTKYSLLASGSFDPAVFLDGLIAAGRIDFADSDSLVDYYLESDALQPAVVVTSVSDDPVVSDDAPVSDDVSVSDDPVVSDEEARDGIVGAAVAKAGKAKGVAVLDELDVLAALPRALARQASPLEFSDVFLDPLAYLENNPDLDADTRHLVEHYVLFGCHEGRIAPATFDAEDYLTRYPDIRAAGMVAFDHYLRHGLNEGRTVRVGSGPSRSDIGGRRFEELLGLIVEAPEEPTRRGTILLRWWRDFLSTSSIASLQNVGWVGGAPMSPTASYLGLRGATSANVKPAFQAVTAMMQQLFYSDLPPPVDVAVGEMVVRSRTKSRQVAPQPLRRISDEGVSIITPFFRHLGFFGECAASVELLRCLSADRLPDMPFEWVLVNDDPNVSMATLRALIPASLLPHVKLIQGGGLKTTGATNLGLSHAANGWLLFLDCDDVLMPHAVLTMEHYTSRFASRYFASSIIDIDVDGRTMRYRPHVESSLWAPVVGMNAGHLKCVHRSLFDDYGQLDAMFDGCQDYEFLLRVLDSEDVVLVPEYLYLYRWHSNTQSVSTIAVQEQKATLAKKIYIRGRAQRTPAVAASPRRVAALIRTTGERLDSLKETILSCWSLHPEAVIEPVVIVHGDADRHALVESCLKGMKVSVLHAHDVALSRGYPLNLGARFAFDELGCDGFGILDDDDIYLPGMHQMARTIDPDALTVHAGRVLRKSLDGAIDEPYPPMPAAYLTTANFLPTNGLIVTRALAEKVEAVYGELFPSDMFYLEDYVFLLRCWGAGGDVTHFDMFVGEFRMGSDGNTQERKYPFEFQRCAAKARVFANALALHSKDRLMASVEALPQKMARRIAKATVSQILGTIN